MSTLPQQNTINQYLSDGITTVYPYSYLILLNTDISVYVTASVNAIPNPPQDIQVLNEDYSVQNVGNVTGGTITFLEGAPASGSVITVARSMQETITTNFSDARTITGSNLDAAFQRCMLVSQQIQSQLNTFGLQYPIDQFFSPPQGSQNILPALGSGQVWAGTGVGFGVTATTIVNGADSLLRSQLASATAGAPGASMVGYYNPKTATSTTVDLALKALQNGFVQVNSYPVTATGAFTYTPTAGTVVAIFELQSGGAASGSTTGTAGQSATAGAGGGGAYQKILVTGAANLAAIAGHVGIGGVAGAAGNNAGGNGGITDLTINGGSTWTSSGGAGGSGQTSSAATKSSGTPGVGGANVSGTNATLILGVPGISGGYGISYGTSATLVNSGLGGGSFLSPANQTFGGSGALYGGGAPSSLNATGSDAAGNNGAQGVIIVTEFIGA